MADQGTGIDYRRICVTCNRVVAAIREAHALPPIQPPIQSQRSVPQARRKTHDNILMAIPVMQAALQKYGVIQKARHVDLQRDIGLQEQISNLSQKTKNVAEKAQTLEQVVATLEVRQHQTQAPVSAPQAALAKENIDEQMSEVKVLADGIVHKFQDKAEALEQIVTRLEEHQRRAVATPINAVMFEQKIHDKMSAVKLLAEGLVENLNILEQKEGRVAPVQRGLEYPLASAELETQHQHMTLEAQQWKAKHEDQICQMQDLMLRYEELARAHDSQAARARELEVGHKTLQEQVERLTQQNVAHQESIQTLAPAADDAKCRELELHEVVLQAKGEAQQWQDLHQRAQAQYESAMLELQQSQLAGQQAAQDADTHRQELLSKQAELVQMSTLRSKVMQLENLVADKQQEVDRLSQQLRGAQAGHAEKQQEVDRLNQQLRGAQAGQPAPKQEIAQAGKAAPKQENVEATRDLQEIVEIGKAAPKQEAVEGTTLGSVIEEIAKLKQSLRVSSPKSMRTISPPKSSSFKEQTSPVSAASSFKGYLVKGSSYKGSASPPPSELVVNSAPTVASLVRTASPPTSERVVTSVPTLASPVAVEHVNPANTVAGLDAARSSPTARVRYSPAASARATAPAATNARATASSQFPYPTTAAALQASAAYTQVSLPRAVGAAMEIPMSYQTLAPQTAAPAFPSKSISAI